MSKKTCMILAAGMGSRYGGLKQLDEIGPNKETIIDYSVFDAIQAGFDKIVFVIRSFFAKDFEEKIISKYKNLVEVKVVFQEIDTPLNGVIYPDGREKPWGTGHAVLVGKEAIHEPFAVINADDYYGKSSFNSMASFLDVGISSNKNGLIVYQLGNTLSENGSVSRGVCTVDDYSQLRSVTERTKISKENEKITYQDGDLIFELDEKLPVSMNFWGFDPSIFDSFDNGFQKFIQEYNSHKSEFFIPLVVDNLIKSGEKVFEAIPSDSNWIGVTYKEDKEYAQSQFLKLHQLGLYPEVLFPKN